MRTLASILTPPAETLGERPRAVAIPAQQRSPARIVFVIAGLGAGGAERVISLIAGAWVAQGRQVSVIAFDDPATPTFHRFDPRVRLVRLAIPPVAGWRGAFTSLRRLIALRRALRESRAELAISFLTKINVLSLLASLGAPHRLIVSERNNPERQQLNPLWRVLLRRLEWRADGLVMQTRASLACIGRAAVARAQVISNPVKLAPPATGGRRPTLVAVGRLTHQKGFDLLIEAFARVADRHPDWTLLIWGEGEARATLEAQVAALGLAERVSLPGTSRSIEDWVCGAGAFVLSSRYEGFSNVLIEAMAAGLAVASFDCAYGPGEIITPDIDGLLVPDRDVAALAAAIDRLMADPALRARLGAAARAIGERYALPAIVAQWEAAAERALAR
jgi:glycosyltransferase involved in cell wall biosynthesis